MPFEPGLSRRWYNVGRKHGKEDKYLDMYTAWSHVKERKPTTPGGLVTAKESFFQGFMDTRYVAENPRRKGTKVIPAKWTTAKVRRLSNGRVQVMLHGRSSTRR